MKILKKTKKAILVEKEGFSFWVQKRWINKNGELTKRGLIEFDWAKREPQPLIFQPLRHHCFIYIA